MSNERRCEQQNGFFIGDGEWWMVNQNVIMARDTINHSRILLCFVLLLNFREIPNSTCRSSERNEWNFTRRWSNIWTLCLLWHAWTHIYLQSDDSSHCHVYDNYFKALKIYCLFHQLLLLPVFTILILTNNFLNNGWAIIKSLKLIYTWQ